MFQKAQQHRCCAAGIIELSEEEFLAILDGKYKIGDDPRLMFRAFRYAKRMTKGSLPPIELGDFIDIDNLKAYKTMKRGIWKKVTSHQLYTAKIRVEGRGTVEMIISALPNKLIGSVGAAKAGKLELIMWDNNPSGSFSDIASIKFWNRSFFEYTLNYINEEP